MIKLINYIGYALGVVGFAVPSLNPVVIRSKALSEAGLSDEPKESKSYEKGLNMLSQCLEDSKLTMLGRLVAQGMLTQSLKNRFLVDDFHSKNPKCSEQKVKPPLIIVGMARTGTTFLHGLLSQDPQYRVPCHWEYCNIPKPGQDDVYLRKKAKDDLENYKKIIPNFSAFHHVGFETPEECCVIFQQDMLSESFSGTLNCSIFTRWMMDQDLSSVTRHHERVLQYYQFKDMKFAHENNNRYENKQWVLKTPNFLIMLPEILKQYPDAQIVWTHRNPSDVLKSLLGLIVKMTGAVTDDVDPYRIAKEQRVTLAMALAKAMDNRAKLEDKGHSKQFFDVRFDELCKDPMEMVKKIYRHFDKKLSTKAKEQMETYLKNNKRFKHGKGIFDLEGTFKVTKKDMELGPYVAYRERFSV